MSKNQKKPFQAQQAQKSTNSTIKPPTNNNIQQAQIKQNQSNNSNQMSQILQQNQNYKQKRQFEQKEDAKININQPAPEQYSKQEESKEKIKNQQNYKLPQPKEINFNKYGRQINQAFLKVLENNYFSSGWLTTEHIDFFSKLFRDIYYDVTDIFVVSPSFFQMYIVPPIGRRQQQNTQMKQQVIKIQDNKEIIITGSQYPQKIVDCYNMEAWQDWYGKGNQILENHNQIIFPINLNNSHWTCLRVNKRKQYIQYLDSLSNSLSNVHVDGVLKLFPDNKFKTILDSPKQNNCHDCGVFVLKAIQTSFEIGDQWIDSSSYTQKDITNFRNKLINLAMKSQETDLKDKIFKQILKQE